MQPTYAKMLAVTSIRGSAQKETTDDERTRTRLGPVATAALGHPGRRAPSEKDCRRARGEWNQRPPGAGRRRGKTDCPGTYSRGLPGAPRGLPNARPCRHHRRDRQVRTLRATPAADLEHGSQDRE